MPHAWPVWLTADDGAMLVATVGPTTDGRPALDANGEKLLEGQPVAVSRVALLSPTEGWVEGIRVDPRVRGMGVATDLQVAELHWLAANRTAVTRYATSQRNEGSHRLGARHVAEPVGGGRPAPGTVVAKRTDLGRVRLRAGEVLTDPHAGLAAHAAREPADRLREDRALLGAQLSFLDLVSVDEREREGAKPSLQLVPPALCAGERGPAQDERDEEQDAEDSEHQRADAEGLEHRYLRPSTAWTRALSSRGLNGFRM